MQSIVWESVVFYCLFLFFIVCQIDNHSNFQGASEGTRNALKASSGLGIIVGIVYLVYYGWTIIWWAPILVFLIGLISILLGSFINQLIPTAAVSMLGFIGWPICAFFMFHFIPRGK
jgi:xanthosine utilization system XapX-like protein